MQKKSRAYQAFEIAIERAGFYYDLYHGLINIRKYDIRSDWSRKFKRLMHWKENSIIHRIDSRDAIIVLKDGANISVADFSTQRLSNLLRASLALAVSALDAYFHAKIVDNVSRSIKPDREIASALKKVSLNVEEYFTACQSRKKKVPVRRAVERTLSYKALQQPPQISEALAIIKVKSFWGNTAKRMGMKAEDVRKELNSIVVRRNQIVHEGDISRSTKSGIKTRDIEPSNVKKAIEFIQVLIKAAEAEIEHQLASL
jgi:hypothetical protein